MKVYQPELMKQCPNKYKNGIKWFNGIFARISGFICFFELFSCSFDGIFVLVPFSGKN